MANWHYYNKQGDKITVTSKELKALALQGVITPGTMVETEDGKNAPARRVKGLTFGTSLPPNNSVQVPDTVNDVAAIDFQEKTDITSLPQEQSAIISKAESSRDAFDLSSDQNIGKVVCPNCGASLEYAKNPSNLHTVEQQQQASAVVPGTICCLTGCVFMILFFPIGILLWLIALLFVIKGAWSANTKQDYDWEQVLVCGNCGHHFRSHWKGALYVDK